MIAPPYIAMAFDLIKVSYNATISILLSLIEVLTSAIFQLTLEAQGPFFS
jgi:hypothetical protein